MKQIIIDDEYAISELLFEHICKSVHDTWWKEEIKQGVTDHPDMIHYELLSEEVKDYVRKTVKAVLSSLVDLELL